MINPDNVQFFIDSQSFDINTDEIFNQSNFQVNSKFSGYKVYFKQFDLNQEYINSITRENSLIIIDSKLIEIHNLVVGDFMIVIESNEENKSFEKIELIVDKLISKEVTKGTQLIAIGGGVVQDITAFVSMIFRRGIKWRFFPSTLLAQSDSCIGAKTAINYKGHKNLIGLFSSPYEVIINSSFNKTLSDADLLNGYGEIIKLSILAGEFFFKRSIELINKKELYLEDFESLINQALRIKKIIIEFDEFEETIRQSLNYGHSVGHAIESASNFSIPHGISVLIGILVENRISLKLDLCNLNFVAMIEKPIIYLLRNKILNLGLFSLDPLSITNAIKLDKKIEGNVLPTILPKGFGDFLTVKIMIDYEFNEMFFEIFRELENGFTY